MKSARELETEMAMVCWIIIFLVFSLGIGIYFGVI